jgi:hypothetical protein
MSDNAEIFFEEFVVGLGFVSGLWYAIKLDPLAEMFKALAEIIKILMPESKLGLLLLLIPPLILVFSILAAYSMGGEWGLIAVFCGFLAGGLISVTDGFSIFLLFVGMVLGAFAVSSKRDNFLF